MRRQKIQCGIRWGSRCEEGLKENISMGNLLIVSIYIIQIWFTAYVQRRVQTEHQVDLHYPYQENSTTVVLCKDIPGLRMKNHIFEWRSRSTPIHNSTIKLPCTKLELSTSKHIHRSEQNVMCEKRNTNPIIKNIEPSKCTRRLHSAIDASSTITSMTITHLPGYMHLSYQEPRLILPGSANSLRSGASLTRM